MPCIRDHVIRLECEDEKLITIPPHCLLAPGLEQVPRKHLYHALMAVSGGSGPEVQRGVAVRPGGPVQWGPARTFPGKGESRGGQSGL